MQETHPLLLGTCFPHLVGPAIPLDAGKCEVCVQSVAKGGGGGGGGGEVTCKQGIQGNGELEGSRGMGNLRGPGGMGNLRGPGGMGNLRGPG